MVDFERERHDAVEYRINTQDEERVVYQTGHSTYRERPVAETNQDVKANAEQSKYDSPHRRCFDVVGNRRAYFLRTLYAIVVYTAILERSGIYAIDNGVTLNEHFFRNLLIQIGFQIFVQHCFDNIIDGVAVVFDSIVGRNAHLIVGTHGYHVQLRAIEHGTQRFAQGFGIDRLFETYHIVTSAREVDTLFEAARRERHNSNHQQYARDDITHNACFDKVELRVLEPAACNIGSERDVAFFVAFYQTFVHQTCQEHGRKHRSDDTDNQRCGKAFDGACAKIGQNDTGQNGCNVGVDDGRQGVSVTIADGFFEVFACAQLFANAFIYQHIGIDGHTHCQHYTGDTRQGEHCLERRQDAEQEEYVAKQCQVGNESGNESVVEHHI